MALQRQRQLRVVERDEVNRVRRIGPDGTQAMEGDLKVSPGATLNTGL